MIGRPVGCRVLGAGRALVCVFVRIPKLPVPFNPKNNQDYPAAAATYESLLEVCPDVEEYRVYLAQALYKAGCYHEATRAAARVESPRYARRMLLLQVVIDRGLSAGLGSCAERLLGRPK